MGIGTYILLCLPFIPVSSPLRLQQLRSFGIVEKIRSDHYATACEREVRQHNTLALTVNQVSCVL